MHKNWLNQCYSRRPGGKVTPHKFPGWASMTKGGSHWIFLRSQQTSFNFGIQKTLLCYVAASICSHGCPISECELQTTQASNSFVPLNLACWCNTWCTGCICCDGWCDACIDVTQHHQYVCIDAVRNQECLIYTCLHVCVAGAVCMYVEVCMYIYMLYIYTHVHVCIQIYICCTYVYLSSFVYISISFM